MSLFSFFLLTSKVELIILHFRSAKHQLVPTSFKSFSVVLTKISCSIDAIFYFSLTVETILFSSSFHSFYNPNKIKTQLILTYLVYSRQFLLFTHKLVSSSEFKICFRIDLPWSYLNNFRTNDVLLVILCLGQLSY